MDQLEDLQYHEEYLVQKAMVKGVPITIAFELTPYCNMNCNMCFIRNTYQGIRSQGGLLPLDTWKDIALKLKAQGTLFILLTGGEPLTYPHFKELYLFLRNEGFIITINTNGTLINDEIISLFAANKPRRVNLTIYGSSNETYHKLCHNPNGYNLAISALKRLQENGISTKINVTITKDNKNDFDDLLRLSTEFDMPIMSTSHLYPFGRFGKSYLPILDSRVSPKEAALLEWQIKAHEKHISQKEFYTSLCSLKENSKPNPNALCVECKAGKSSAWVNWRGYLTPCIFMETPSADIKTEEVKEAWNYIKDSTCKLEPIQDCKGCTKRDFCNVCYASAKLEKEATDGLDYLCKMAEEKIHILNSFEKTEL